MPSIADLRAANPWADDISDLELLDYRAQQTGTSLEDAAKAFGVKYNAKRNALTAGLSSGVDQAQGLGYGVLGAGARAVGLDSAADWADKNVRINNSEAHYNGRPDLENIETQTLGSMPGYLVYQGAKQIPMLAGTVAASAVMPEAVIPAALSRGLAYAPRAIGGGGLTSGALEAAQGYAAKKALTNEAIAAGNQFGRIGAASYPMSVGSLYNEAVERGDPTQGDALAAFAGGVPYAAGEAVMPAIVTRGLGTGLGFKGNLPTRIGKAMATDALGEAGTELVQNEMEMGFRPDLTDEQRDSRRLNSAVAGGLVGGMFGAPAGIRQYRQPVAPGAETDLLGGNGYPNQSGAALSPLGPNPTPGQGQLAFPLDSEANIGTQGSPVLTAGPAGVDVTGAYDIPYGVRNPFDVAGHVTGLRNGNIASIGDEQGDVFGTQLNPNAGLETLEVAPPATSPMAQAREAFIANGGSPRAWATFVSKNSLIDADEQTLGAAILDKANNPKTTNSAPWIATYEAFNPEGTANGNQENVARGQEGTLQAGQPQGTLSPRKVRVVKGTTQGGGIQQGRNGQAQGLLNGAQTQEALAAEQGQQAAGPVANPAVTVVNATESKQVAPQAVQAGATETTQKPRRAARAVAADLEAFVENFKLNTRQSKEKQAEAKARKSEAARLANVIRVNTSPETVESAIDQAEALLGNNKPAATKTLKDIADASPEQLAVLNDARGFDDEGHAVFEPMTQRAIAEKRGMSVANVNKILKQFFGDDTQGRISKDNAQTAGVETGAAREMVRTGQLRVIKSAGASTENTGSSKKSESLLKKLEARKANLEKEGRSKEEIAKLLTRDPNMQEYLRLQKEESEQVDHDQEVADEAYDYYDDGAPDDVYFDQFQGKWSDEKMAAARKRAINQAIARMKGRDVPPARKPMMLSRLTKLLNGVYEGTISDGQLVNELGWLTQQLMDVKASKEMAEGKDRVRGADYFRQRLLEAKRNGWISETEADFAEWMVKKNPALLDDLAIAIKTSPENSTAAGSYNPALRLVTLFKDHGPDTTAVHEILHHLERMLPHELRKPLAKEYARRLIKEYQGSTGTRKVYFEKVFELMANPSRKLMDEALTLLEKSGDINDYQYITLSEFWAENGTDLLKARFDANDSAFKRIAQFMREIVQKLKSLLNMKTDAPLIKALDHVLNGNGEFVEKNMLVNNGADTYLSYVGEKAQTIAKENIEKAKEMDAAGADQETIRLATGWFKGKYDGKWRQEVSDELADFKEPVENLEESVLFKEPKHYRLGDVLDHPELFAAYPEAADIKFLVRKGLFDFGGLQGWFNPETNEIGVTPYADDKLGTVMHELQHWIQNKEGFATGGNANTVMDNLTDQQREKVATDLIKKLRREFVKAVENEDAANTFRKKLQDVRAEWVVWTTAYKEQTSAFDRLQNVLDELRNLKDHGAKPSQMLLDLENTLRKEHSKKYDDAWAAEKNIRQILFGTDDYFALTDEQRSAWSHIAAQKREAESIDDLRVAGEKADLTGLNKRITALQSGDPEALKNEIKKAGLAHTYYTRIAGEIEARDTSARREMSYAEREATAPYSSEDIAAEDAFVTFEKVESNSSNGPTVSFSSKANPSTPDGFFSKLGGMLDDFTANPAGAFSKMKLGWMTLDQIADRVKSATVKAYVNTMTSMQKFSKDLVYKAALIDQDWAQLSPNLKDNLSSVMRDATRMGFDPDVDDATDNAQQALKNRFRALTPTAQGVYRRVRDHYETMFQERKQILMEAAANGTLSEKNRAEVERMFTKAKGPYFPLMRIGNWYAVGMSNELAELTDKVEAGTASKEETDRYSELRKDKASYITKSFDTRQAAKRWVKSQGAAYDQAYFNTGKSLMDNAIKSTPDLAKMQDYLSSGLPAGARDDVKNMLAQMYFDMLPESSALKRMMKREGVYGEEEDMRKVFAASSISMAHHVSRLKYANKLSEHLTALDKQTKRNEDLRHVYNELVERSNLATKSDDTPFTDTISNISYFAHLGLSPAFILTNMTQVPMITAPWLIARYGFGKTKSALASAYVDAYKIIKGTMSNDGWQAEYNWSDLFKEGSNEDKLLKELLDRNLLDITMEHDLGAVARIGGTGGKNAWNTTVKIAGLPVRATEAANRIVTGLASYRLAMDKGMTHEDAVNHAAKSISETQLNYSALNAPRYMQSVFGSKALAKLVYQFRKYQQGMVYLIVKNAKDSLKGDKEAMKTLFGLMTTTGLMAGTTGLPFAGSVFWLATAMGSMFDDDDEPFDAREAFRNYLANATNDEIALALTKGLPTLFGADLSGNVGMGNLGMPLPYVRDGKKPSDSAKEMLASAAGASFGTMTEIADGIAELAGGDINKGMQHVIPLKLAKNILKAASYAENGMVDSKGNVIIPAENFDAWDLSLRASGFSGTKETEYYEANSAMQKAKAAATDTRHALLREYAEARMKGEDVADFQKKIADFNTRHPEKGIRIDQSSLIKSVQARKKLAQERTDTGLRTDKTMRPYLKHAQFADGE